MKIILTARVDNLGGPGEQVEVATGYARNYLLPRGLAVEATRANLNIWQDRIARMRVQEEREVAEARQQAERIDGRQLTFTAKAGDKGQLFGSVTSGDIAGELGVDRKQVVLPESIKALGEVTVAIRLHPSVSATVTVNVIAETEQSSPDSEDDSADKE